MTKLFVLIQFIVNCLVPFSILLILNILVLKKCIKMNQMLELEFVSSSESRLEKSVFLAKFSLLVVFVFMICYSVRWIVMIQEVYLLHTSKDVVSPWKSLKMYHFAMKKCLYYRSLICHNGLFLPMLYQRFFWHSIVQSTFMST